MCMMVVMEGHEPPNRYRRAVSKLCSVQSWKRRVPITIWLPKYKWDFLLRDMIAGITVGLTSIPQGIAYAILAGLPPQVGLYSSIFPGAVYAVFGSCYEVTVGPTAILAALLAKYVALSPDFAYLSAFLSGCFIFMLGFLQLGFILDFISKPVISGFTTAAALQISASQFKSLFRTEGKSGGTFIGAVISFVKNIKTVHLWDTLLGITTIVALFILKRCAVCVWARGAWLYALRARNAVVVFVGATLAYCLSLYGYTPFALTGTIHGGLPDFGPPPFSTKIGNETVNFEGMLSVLGPEALVMPLVAILESIAIARAFAGSKSVDATQEMLALGLCNAVASCCGAMPATGSFTRTALNHASGVATPAAALFKAGLVLLSVTLLSSSFYFIPRATLAGVIIVAMISLIDVATVTKLWRHSKWELAVLLLTILTGACIGLEYGIVAGAGADLLRVAIIQNIPRAKIVQISGVQVCVLPLVGTVTYGCASRVRRCVSESVSVSVSAPLLVDGTHCRHVDCGVAEDIASALQELEDKGRKYLLWNFSEANQRLFEDVSPQTSCHFVTGPTVDQHILNLQVTR